MKVIGFNKITAPFVGVFIATVLCALLISFTACDKKDAATTSAILRTREIALLSTVGSTINGKAVIAENADHSFNILITLQNTVKDTVMVMHIHNGSITAPGTISIPLTDITGTGAQASGTTLNINSGTSAAGVKTNLSYDNIISYAGYFNVHYSAAQIGKIVANGDIK
jgi:hypothetical protein